MQIDAVIDAVQMGVVQMDVVHKGVPNTVSEIPTATGEAWLRLPRFYVGAVVDVLIAQGVGVHGWWAGARDPRDATVRLTGGSALVWDEECGWRLGTFVSGDEGAHTELDDVLYLSGGLLPRT